MRALLSRQRGIHYPRVQADRGRAGGQNIAQQKLEKKTLSLAGVAENEGISVGFVLHPAVQVQDDVGAEAVLSNIEFWGRYYRSS